MAPRTPWAVLSGGAGKLRRATVRARAAATKAPQSPSATLGITTTAGFSALMGLPTKDAHLLSALAGFAIDVSFDDPATAEKLLLWLLTEPGLSKRNLLDIVRARYCTSGDLLPALCGHPQADVNVIIVALWEASPGATQCAPWHTGNQLAAVVAWLQRHKLLGGFAAAHARARISGYDDRRIPGCNDDPDNVAATDARWATWCAGDPRRAAFLLTASANFDTEADMFAAGAAITAQPQAT